MWGGGGGLSGCDPGGQRCSGGQELTSSSSLLPDGRRWENVDIRDIIEGWNLPICLCMVEEEEVDVGRKRVMRKSATVRGRLRSSGSLKAGLKGPLWTPFLDSREPISL